MQEQQQERILLVEDNKALAKLVAKKLSSALEMEVDLAFSLAEAKLFLQRYKYFVTVLDINLPDAPDGQVVDYAIKKGNHVLVLSSNIDKEFRHKMLEKKIIDYINKGGPRDIDYIIDTIKRLQKNRQHKVLVVDDSMMFRNQMKSLLENLFFKVITVAHGEEAVGMLLAHPDISLVITDYNMPVMNGLELTLKIRETFSKDQLSILALSGNDDDEIIALFLKQGANDYIKKPFSKEEFYCRVNNQIEALENIQTITKYANRDYLTGLYNRRYFYTEMENIIEEARHSGEQLAIAMLDIDHFKKVNDTYGHDVGDKVIVALADILRSNTSSNDIVARFGGEEFCVVLKNINRYSAAEIYERLRSEVEKHVLHLPNSEEIIRFTVSIGAVMYSLEDSLDDNLNEADMNLYKAKNNGRNQLVFE